MMRTAGRERGSSSIMTLLCALIILVTVLTATHVLLSLQRRSVAHAVAMDAVTDLARADSPDPTWETERIRRLLGSGTVVEWSERDADLVLHVRLRPRSVIERGPLARLARIDVVVTARREELVDDVAAP